MRRPPDRAGRADRSRGDGRKLARPVFEIRQAVAQLQLLCAFQLAEFEPQHDTVVLVPPEADSAMDRRRMRETGRRLADGYLLVGTALCGAAWSLPALIAGRVLQAVGACAGIVLSRAMIRDVYDREAAARGLALVMMAMTLAPAISPALGA